MPYDEPDASDPLEAMAVELPATREAWRDMACCFAEEFARLGFGVERIRLLFETPFYQGPFKARQVLGKTEIEALIAEALFLFGRPKPEIQDAPEVEVPENADPFPPAGPCEVRTLGD